jgi:TolB protein
MRHLLGLTVASALVAALAALPAAATYPAKNGVIAFGRNIGSDGTRALFVINADGSGERRLTSPPAGVSDDQPDWSPDSSLIVFERLDPNAAGGEVWVVNAHRRKAHRLGPLCKPDPKTCLNDNESGPAYAPDGKLIAFGRGWGSVRSNQIQYGDIYLMSSDGTGARRLTTVTARAPYSADVGSPMWSPDGKRLVFEVHHSALSKPAYKRALFIVNADGSGLRRLTPWKLNGGGNPDWSPSGKRILFRTVSNDELHGNLYTIRPNGRGLRKLTHYGRATIVLSYSFSPDGKSITFAKSGVGGQPDVFVMRANGTNVRAVTRTPLPDSAPDWGSAP